LLASFESACGKLGSAIKEPFSSLGIEHVERQQRQITRPFDGTAQISLMLRTSSRNATRNNFAFVGNKKGKSLCVFETQIGFWIGAKFTDFFTSKFFLFFNILLFNECHD